MRIFASLYADEDIANLVATLLRARGIDVLTTLDASMTGRSDAEQLAYAAAVEKNSWPPHPEDAHGLWMSSKLRGRVPDSLRLI
jgi:hypothetical protein